MSYRYIGNKRSLLTWILERARWILPNGGVVADPMCGTATVAEGLRHSGFKVIASDIMTYSLHHARVRLNLDASPDFGGIGMSYWGVLDFLARLDPIEGYIYREYGASGRPTNGAPPRKYFTSENSAKIDAINQTLRNWEESSAVTPLEASLLRHDLILAANRVANIAGTYGHFRSSWSEAALQRLELKPTTFVWGYRNDHVVLQGPVEQLAHQITADLCYLDPPYMKRQYAANYHIPETLARGDEPEAIGISGLRPWRDQYSDFCSKRRLKQSFTRVFNEMACPHFLISYSEDGLFPIDELVSLCRRFGQVVLEEKEYSRFRSNSSLLSPNLTEYLIHLKIERP